MHVAVAPVIPNECSDELLRGCGRLMRDTVSSCRATSPRARSRLSRPRWKHGQTVVARLSRCGLLGPRFVAGHAVWVTDEDIRVLAATGSSVVHNPASNLRLGSGIAPVREFLDVGLNVGLGSDGSLTSDNQNMFEAMRFAGTVGTIRFPYRADRWVAARDVWRMATTGGAAVVAQDGTLGRVEAGRKADLIILRTDSTMMTPLFSSINALVYAQSGADVRTVLVSGQVLSRTAAPCPGSMRPESSGGRQPRSNACWRGMGRLAPSRFGSPRTSRRTAVGPPSRISQSIATRGDAAVPRAASLGLDASGPGSLTLPTGDAPSVGRSPQG